MSHSEGEGGSRFARLLYGPTTLIWGEANEIEVSVHECRAAFLRETEPVLPGVDLSGLLAVATMQRALHDLVKIGDEIEVEKDRLLETFMAFAKALCERLKEQGHWADYIDPCSGLAMLTPEANKVFSEVDSAQQLLGYGVMNCGCCKVLLHPSWSSAVYPATIFTTAPRQVVIELFPQIAAVAASAASTVAAAAATSASSVDDKA